MGSGDTVGSGDMGCGDVAGSSGGDMAAAITLAPAILWASVVPWVAAIPWAAAVPWAAAIPWTAVLPWIAATSVVAVPRAPTIPWAAAISGPCGFSAGHFRQPSGHQIKVWMGWVAFRFGCSRSRAAAARARGTNARVYICICAHTGVRIYGVVPFIRMPMSMYGCLIVSVDSFVRCLCFVVA